MKFQIGAIFFIFCFCIFSCSTTKNIGLSNTNKVAVEKDNSTLKIKMPSTENEIAHESVKQIISDTTFVNLNEFSNDFVYDMKYATTDNFLKSKVYDCAECYLRFKTVKALVEANKRFMKKGYRIKLFDCYRPLDIQRKMWNIVSNPEYVANPMKGSIHNRGGAVDITLVDEKGKELDMGTAFDFFGIQASHNYENLSEEVKKNRSILRNGMTRYDFRIFESEWWHYNLKNSKKDKVSNFKWKCD